MMQHQPGDGLGFLRRQAQLGADLLRHLGAQFGMIAAAALGDVVQQGRHIQRTARLQLRQKFAGNWRDLGQLIAVELAEHADGLHRMLIHRVHMVGVELHQPHDARPVGQVARQESRLVQLPQPHCRIAPTQKVEEDGPRLGIAAQLHRVARLPDQRPKRERVDVQRSVARQLHQAQHQHRLLAEIEPRCGDQLAIGQREAGIGQRAVGSRQHRGQPQRGALDRGFEHAREAGDVARGDEQVLHEALDTILLAVARVTHARPDHRLEVEGQAFLGAAGDQVQMKSHGPEEVPGTANGLRFLLGDQPAAGGTDAHQFGHALHAEGVARKPVQRLQVAQPAAALLQVRLDQEGAVAVARVAARAFGPLGREELSETPIGACLGEVLGEAREDGGLAGETARIEQRRQDGGIGFRVVEAIGDAARGMPDLEPQIPEQIEHELDRALAARRHRGFREEQQVDVRERCKHTAPIAARRHQAKGGLLLPRVGHHRLGVAVDRFDQGIGECRHPARGRQARQRLRLEALLHLRMDAPQVPSQQAQRLLTPDRGTPWQQGGDEIGKDIRMLAIGGCAWRGAGRRHPQGCGVAGGHSRDTIVSPAAWPRGEVPSASDFSR